MRPLFGGMKPWVVVLVVAGIALSILYGVLRGFDYVAAMLLVLIVVLGVLAVAAAAKERLPGIEPGRCESCGGLISEGAPYCKHCGARRA